MVFARLALPPSGPFAASHLLGREGRCRPVVGFEDADVGDGANATSVGLEEANVENERFIALIEPEDLPEK